MKLLSATLALLPLVPHLSLAQPQPNPPLSEKPLLNPPLPSLDIPLRNAFTDNHLVETTQWPQGTLPADCHREVTQIPGLSAWDVEVVTVQYDDCDQPWVMCRHTSAPTTIGEAVDIFGVLPVALRSLVKHVVLLPGGRSGAFFADNIMIFGEGTNLMTLMTHEAGHALDSYGETGLVKPFHESQEWVNAINNDKSISDGYAQSDIGENFAQETVIALFDKVVPGGVAAQTTAYRDIFNQYSTVKRYMEHYLTTGGQCNRIHQDSPTVPWDTPRAAGSRKRRNMKARFSPVGTRDLGYEVCLLEH